MNFLRKQKKLIQNIKEQEKKKLVVVEKWIIYEKMFKRGNAIYNNYNIIKYRKIEINNYVIWYFKTNLNNFKKFYFKN